MIDKSDLVVANCDHQVLDRLIRTHHYSGTCPTMLVGYGVWYRDRLAGGIVFGNGVGGKPNAYCRICESSEVIELTRLWIADAVPANSESRVLGVALRHLRQHRGRFRAVLSYADEMAGHVGTIYQATNWRYMGSASSSGSKIKIGTQLFSSRSFNARYGTHSLARLKTILGRDDISYIGHETRKHAYIYPLTPEVAAWCDLHQQPYPKRS